MSDFLYERDGGSSLRIEDNPLDAYVAIFDGRGTTSATISKPKRQAAAQAVAGDGYHVVPARDSDDGWIAVQRSEYERLLDRDEFPRVQGTCPSCDVLPAIERLKSTANPAYTDEDWRKQVGRVVSQLGIEDAVINRPPVDIIDVIRGAIRRLTQQPDRPEPVDPSKVRVGDIVDYETTVEYRLCRIMGEVEDATDHVTGEDGWSLKLHDKWWSCNIATVRILQRPEPELDTEQVDALYNAIYRTDEGQRQVHDNQDGRAIEYRAIAEGLIRSGKVQVVPDE